MVNCCEAKAGGCNVSGGGWQPRVAGGGKVGLTTLGQPRLSEGAQPYLMQRMTGPVIPT